MKINIICKSYPNKGEKIVWSGELACQFVPRIGECIVVKQGCHPELILNIIYAPHFAHVNVYICSDYDNQYEEVKPLNSYY